MKMNKNINKNVVSINMNMDTNVNMKMNKNINKNIVNINMNMNKNMNINVYNKHKQECSKH